MPSVKDFLDYGAFGLVALLMVVVVVPLVRAFVSEMRASRAERERFWTMHTDYINNAAAHVAAGYERVTAALDNVKDGLAAVARRLDRER